MSGVGREINNNNRLNLSNYISIVYNYVLFLALIVAEVHHYKFVTYIVFDLQWPSEDSCR